MTSAGVMRIAVGFYILLFFAYLFGPLVVMSFRVEARTSPPSTIWVTSPVMIDFEPTPNLVKNIFICVIVEF